MWSEDPLFKYIHTPEEIMIATNSAEKESNNNYGQVKKYGVVCVLEKYCVTTPTSPSQSISFT